MKALHMIILISWFNLTTSSTCGQSDTLRIDYFSETTNEISDILTKVEPSKVRILIIRSPESVTNIDLIAFKNVETVSMNFPGAGSWLDAIYEYRSLTNLTIIDDAVIVSLPECLVNLKHLTNLELATTLSDRNIGILKRCEALTEIKINGGVSSREYIDFIASTHRIKRATLFLSKIDLHYFYVASSEMKQLNELTIATLEKVDLGEILCPNLITLIVPGRYMLRRNVDLVYAKTLTELRLRKLKGSVGQSLNFVYTFPNLKKLELQVIRFEARDLDCERVGSLEQIIYSTPRHIDMQKSACHGIKFQRKKYEHGSV